MKLNAKVLLSIVALTVTAVGANAQDNNNRERGERRERGGDRGNFNPEEFRARFAERMKTSLKVSDEEWTVLQPLIEKVTTKQREGFGGGGFGGRGGGGRGGEGNSDRPGSEERAALRTALENESTPADEIKTKLEAVRALRKRNAAEIATAREELKKVVTVRQEAVLVSMGILE